MTLNAHRHLPWHLALVAADVENPRAIHADAELMEWGRQLGKKIASYNG